MTYDRCGHLPGNGHEAEAPLDAYRARSDTTARLAPLVSSPDIFPPQLGYSLYTPDSVPRRAYYQL